MGKLGKALLHFLSLFLSNSGQIVHFRLGNGNQCMSRKMLDHKECLSSRINSNMTRLLEMEPFYVKYGINCNGFALKKHVGNYFAM